MSGQSGQKSVWLADMQGHEYHSQQSTSDRFLIGSHDTHEFVPVSDWKGDLSGHG